MNKEGYKDPTADRAISHAEHIPKHVKQVLDVLEQAAGISRIPDQKHRDPRSGYKRKVQTAQMKRRV